MSGLIWMPLLISFFLGGVIGWAVAFSNYAPRQIDSGLPTIGVGGGPEEVTRPLSEANSKAASFRVQLNSLLKEHGILASQYLKAVYDGQSPDAISTSLNANSENIATLVGAAFGNGARTDFSNHWQGHIKLYSDYTLALKNRDRATQDLTRQKLQDLSTQMGQFFNKQNSGIAASSFSNLMTEHMSLTLSVIDAYASGDDGALMSNTKENYEQAGRLADFLASAILNASPNQFK